MGNFGGNYPLCFGLKAATVDQVTTYEENLIKRLTEAVAVATVATNGLRYAIAAMGQENTTVTRSDLAAAEARITAAILGHADGMEALAGLVARGQRISGRLKTLSKQLTQLDSTTDSNQTAP